MFHRKKFLPFVYENHQPVSNYISNKYSVGTKDLIDTNTFKETFRPPSHYALMYNYGKGLKEPEYHPHIDNRYTLDQVNSFDSSNYVKR